MELFACDVCSHLRPLEELSGLGCNCSVCQGCCHDHILPCMDPALLHQEQHHQEQCTPPQQYAVGELVRYRQKTGELSNAKIVQIDRSVQPFGYGVELEGATAIRYTEATRLFPQQACLAQGFPIIKCPHCAQPITQPILRQLVPDAVEQLEQALTEAWLKMKGIICCPVPSCGALIEAVPGNSRASAAATCTCGGSGSSSSSSSRSSNSNSSSSSAPAGSQGTCSSCRSLHKELHRYKCTLCSSTFCAACKMSPYHDKLNCREAAAPSCPFCEQRVPEACTAAEVTCYSAGRLREAVRSLGADASWCLERDELLRVYQWASQVCAGCRPTLTEICTRQLPCGHFCCGVRGTTPCTPCLHLECKSFPQGIDSNCCFCFEPLPAAPVLHLGCAGGHYVHFSCAKRRLQVGCPGPALTFDFMFCPLCSSGSQGGRCGNIQVMTAQPHLQHQLLQGAIEKHLLLREQVVTLAKAHLKLAGITKHADLQPGGQYDGRPADYALLKFQFFQCSKCHQAYFGGTRDCAAQPGAAAAFDAKELICGSCSALAAGSNCPHHGSRYIEWKCQYCCSVAAWFCWGTTHMCTPCHDNPRQRQGHLCKGSTCPLSRIPHPAPGASCCLGCGLCRAQ